MNAIGIACCKAGWFPDTGLPMEMVHATFLRIELFPVR